VPTSPPTVRNIWTRIFVGFLAFQVVLVALGVLLATTGRDLAPDATNRIDAMRQVFQSICALGVVAMIAFTRSKLHPENAKSPQELIRATVLALAIGELTVLFALVGLAKNHLDQFLIAAGLVFLADIIMVRPSGSKILNSPIQRK
jgi:hypothetical protein